MLKSHNVVIVNLRVGSRVKRSAVCDLLFKSLSLVNGVVKLGESVTELGSVDKVLKALGEHGVIGLTLCQGRILNGIIVDKGRLNEVLLNEGVEELNQNCALCGDFGKLHVLLFSNGNSLLIGLDFCEINARILLDRLYHSKALPVRKVYFLTLIGYLHSAADSHYQLLHHFLNQIHHADEIGVSLIKLNAGKFWVVLGIHTLVTEDTAYLIYLFKAAHDKAL